MNYFHYEMTLSAATAGYFSPDLPTYPQPRLSLRDIRKYLSGRAELWICG